MFKRIHIPKKIIFIHLLILIYFVVLLLFGKAFTKIEVAGPLYLHDVCLAGIVLLCIVFAPRIKLYFLPILLLFFIALIYFIISLFILRNEQELILMAVRHFTLFIYLICAYIIFCTQVKNAADGQKAINLIKIIGNLSFVVQIIYLLYGFIFIPDFSVFEQADYHYFSPLVVMGIISFCADAISENRGPVTKTLKFTMGLALGLTLGHSSAFLAIFIILMFYAYIKIKPFQRLFSFAFIIVAVLSLFFLPQFTDFNASWRLLYWEHILVRSFTDGYFILGHGFGQPYMTYDYALYINEAINSRGMIDEYYPMARYLNPPHNSILTIVFHVGLIPALLFFVPLKRFFRQIFFEKFPGDPNAMFLILSLCGMIVWISFNVILELPHSATYFWLIYFTTVFYLKQISSSGNVKE